MWYRAPPHSALVTLAAGRRRRRVPGDWRPGQAGGGLAGGEGRGRGKDDAGGGGRKCERRSVGMGSMASPLRPAHSNVRPQAHPATLVSRAAWQPRRRQLRACARARAQVPSSLAWHPRGDALLIAGEGGGVGAWPGAVPGGRGLPSPWRSQDDVLRHADAAAAAGGHLGARLRVRPSRLCSVRV